MISGYPLDRRCQDVAVARYFEGYAPRQNVHSFESAAARQIPMVPAWFPAKAPVPHTISTTKPKRLQFSDVRYEMCDVRFKGHNHLSHITDLTSHMDCLEIRDRTHAREMKP